MSILTPAQIKQLYLDTRPTPLIPLHYYKLDEQSGTTVIDYGSAGINRTNSNAIVNQEGFRGKCYDFNGVGSINLGTNLITTKGSVCGWLNEKVLVDNHYLFGKYNSSGRFYIVSNLATSNYYFGCGTIIIQAGRNRINSWVHLAMTWDGSTVNAYINGESVGTDTNTAMAGSEIYYIGHGGGGSYPYMNAYIQDIRIWDRGVSAREIKDIFLGLE